MRKLRRTKACLTCRLFGHRPPAEWERYLKQHPHVQIVAHVCPRCLKGEATMFRGRYPLRRL